MAIILSLIAGAGFVVNAAYNYTQTRFYIAEESGYVTIYQGIRESFGPLRFSHVYQRTEVLVSDLNEYQQQLVSRSISGDSFEDILNKLATLKDVGK